VSERPSRALWFEAPAAHFNEALPIGNGRLGAMVFGSLGLEVLPINDDRFWAGRAAPLPSKSGPANLARVRERLAVGDNAGAEALVEATLLTEFNQPYLPAADLSIDWGTDSDSGDYRRSLDLGTAIAEVRYGSKGRRVQRRYLASAVDQVIAIGVRGNANEVTLRLSSKLRHRVRVEGQSISIVADAPDNVVWGGVDPRVKPGEGIDYADTPPRRCHVVVHVVPHDGVVVASETSLTVRAANFDVYIATETSESQQGRPGCFDRVADAAALGFDAALGRSVEAHRALFDRAAIRLGAGPCHLPTDRRLELHAAGKTDADLESLIFDYGRYLLISSSRAGTQAANLTGIWNDLVQPPWWSNYTLNINLQMNYWLAEVCNLAECHTPLFDLVAELAAAGEHTARTHYGMAGWVAHHQTDFLRQTTPVGMLTDGPAKEPASYAMWPMSGPWLCQHLWRHYEYGGDLVFLRDRAWPLMRGAAVFLLDWVIETAAGTFTTAPSTSPENRFLTASGERLAVCTGTAMDLSIIRDHFGNCLAAAVALGLVDDPIIARMKDVLARIEPLRIGAAGQIMEWDHDFAEGEHPHRHVSQLFALFPGRAVTVRGTPELAAAARRSLELRGPVGTGWSFAWKMALWARLGSAADAHETLCRLIKPVSPLIDEPANAGGGIYPNLLMACPPFMIDANFGYTAAVAEMLVQSWGEEIELLPALPTHWGRGEFRGLRVPHQLELDLAWEAARPVRLVMRSAINQVRTIRVGGALTRVELKAGVDASLVFLDSASVA
jgi:alpha-L-fucosidase 2